MPSFLTDDISKYGEFISLNNYQYIRIEDVESESKAYISKAYDILDSNRPKESFIRFEQGILLFGNQRNLKFWNNKQDIEWLFITLVHFSKDSKEVFEQFEKWVGTCFAKNDIKPSQWSLYYALDFCDVVLFVKNTPLERYQNALWFFTNVDPGEKNQIIGTRERIVRYTISIYGVNSSVVKRKFADFEKGYVPPKRECGDTFDLSIFLTVQNNEKLDSFTDIISKYRHHMYRKFGRSDLALFIEEVQLEDAIYISWAAIKKCNNREKCEYKPIFDGCVISPMSRVLRDNLSFSCDFANNGCSEYQTFLNFANSVSKELSMISKPLGDELISISNSLFPMMKDSLAEEFYLSVLPSFLVYLKITNDFVRVIIQNKKLGRLEWVNYIDQYVGLLGEYFRTLIMIDHSILHCEKQFFQAPALNAFVYSIPPKLLALYSSLADRIVNYLHDEGDNALYAFVFAPDYKQDVNTKPIECKQVSNAQIGVIYVKEELFYNPKIIIPIMCHEIAHKVGKVMRNREQRARSIFKCFAYYMLFNVLPLCKNKSMEKGCITLVDALASGISSCIMDEFILYKKAEEQCYLSNEATMSSLESFTSRNSGGIEFMKDERFINKLVRTWHEVYRALVDKDNCIGKKDVKVYIEYILKKLNAYYGSSYSLAKNLQSMTMTTIFRSIVNKISLFFKKTVCSDNYASFCDIIMSAYSEAYSDLQMLHIVYGIGICNDSLVDVVEKYHGLIESQVRNNNYTNKSRNIGSDQNEGQNWEQIKQDYIKQSFLRECALRKVINNDPKMENSFTTMIPEYSSQLIFSCSQRELISYLKICLNSIQNGCKEKSKILYETISKYMGVDNCMDIISIRGEIKDYKRRYIEKDCNNLT